MPRHTSPDLRKDWKISLDATVAGAVEFELLDPLTGKPRYAERSRLIGALLANWLAGRGRYVECTMPSEDLYTPPPKPVEITPETGNLRHPREEDDENNEEGA